MVYELNILFSFFVVLTNGLFLSYKEEFPLPHSCLGQDEREEIPHTVIR